MKKWKPLLRKSGAGTSFTLGVSHRLFAQIRIGITIYRYL